MIIKSSQRGSPKSLAKHLESDENEKVTIKELNGVYSNNIHDAFAEFQAISKGSKSKQPLYHVSISPAPTETMSDKGWAKAWEVHDQTHGLKGLQYIEVEHSKNNRTHRHRVYNRINPETGKQ